MILDKILFSQIEAIGKSLLEECGLKSTPENIDEMNLFLCELKKSIEKNEFKGALIANILFSFVSNVDVRDRNTTARTFEDIFSALFGTESTDTTSRINPEPTEELKKLDFLCDGLDWKISTDLAGNKREKTDLYIEDYEISLKTLKGKVYDIDDSVLDTDINPELNVGSLSYRALLKGIISDEKLKALSDRKSGLGSGRQLRENIFNPILESRKKDEFYERLKIFMNYVYEDDVYIVLKSHYRIDFILIPNKTFLNAIYKTYMDKENEFEKIFYRWENNNLRLQWTNILKSADEFGFPYYRINIQLKNFEENKQIKAMKNIVEENLKDFIKDNI